MDMDENQASAFAGIFTFDRYLLINSVNRIGKRFLKTQLVHLQNVNMLTRLWNIFISNLKAYLMSDEFHAKKLIIKISVNQFLKTGM